MKTEELSEPVIKALKTAYLLGQTYWQQADSESYIQNKKSDITYRKFNDLLLSTVTELQTRLQELQQENENVRLANLDCVEHFNALMKDYTELQKELIEIEEREYKNKLIDDPCPGCMKGGVCRTPSCGRLKLPVNHPYRT